MLTTMIWKDFFYCSHHKHTLYYLDVLDITSYLIVLCKID